MTPLARHTLRTYADGMGIPYRDVAKMYVQLDATGKGRALVQMRRLEIAWQEHAAALAEPSWLRRTWALIVAKVRWWRVA